MIKNRIRGLAFQPAPQKKEGKLELKKNLGEVMGVKGGIKVQPKLGKVYFMEFYWNKKRVGGIEMKGKKLHFEGNADKSARALFDCTKKFVEQYIEERLKKEG